MKYIYIYIFFNELLTHEVELVISGSEATFQIQFGTKFY